MLTRRSLRPRWLRDDGPEGNELIAYVVPATGATPDATDLRDHLATLLPEYMIPAAFVVLNALPLLPSGKLDRHALPERGHSRPDLKTAFAAARSATEERLAQIWCELLELDRVGIDDDFFDLGGHSLLVLRLWSRMKESLGCDFPIKLFFRHRTIAQMALVIDEWTAAKSWGAHEQHSASVADRRPRLFCLNTSAAILAEHLDDVPICPIGFYTPEDEAQIWDIDSLPERVKVYIRRMREEQPQGPYRLVGFCGSALVAFEMARQLHEQGDEVPLLILAEPADLRLVKAPSPRAPSLTIRYYRHRFRHHLSRMASVPPRAWPRYCRERISAVFYRMAVAAKWIPGPIEASSFWQQRPQLLKAYATYQPGVYPGKVTLCLSGTRHAVHKNTEAGWRTVAGGGLEVRVIPGDHYTILAHEAHLLAETVRSLYHQSLEMAQGESQ